MTSSNVRKLVTRAGQAAGLPFPAHPHMLRHACGFKLAKDGHDTRVLQHYPGHKNITHTVRYAELAPDRFRSFWRDQPSMQDCRPQPSKDYFLTCSSSSRPSMTPCTSPLASPVSLTNSVP